MNSSFQGGWFWHKDEDDQLRSIDELVDKHSKSVGRNTNMLLGVVVDDRGLVPDVDVKRLEEFGNEISAKYAHPVAKKVNQGKLVHITFDVPQQLSRIVVMEDISKGERIREYNLYGKENGAWKLLSTGSSVGHKRIEVVEGVFQAVKFEVTKADGKFFLKELACY